MLVSFGGGEVQFFMEMTLGDGVFCLFLFSLVGSFYVLIMMVVL